MTKRTIILISLICLVLIAVGVYLFKNPVSKKEEIIKHNPCLANNEIIDYTIDERYAKEIKIPTIPVTIFIRDRDSNKVKYSFTIDNLTPLLRIQKCGVYVVREFNKESPNYRTELWRYDYMGYGTLLFPLSLFKEDKVQGISYSSGFTIDPQEKYLGLERSYLGGPDYAFVIKDVKTMVDIFVLTLNDVKKINPNVQDGLFGLGNWTPDSKYLWGPLFDGALYTAYLWVNTENWKVEVLSPPLDLPSGAERVINFTGYIAYADFPTFFGIDIIAKQEQEKFIKEGRIKHLYLYNLRTKEKKLIADTADPAWQFNIKWLSDTELQYEMPDGEKKIFTIH